MECAGVVVLMTLLHDDPMVLGSHSVAAYNGERATDVCRHSQGAGTRGAYDGSVGAQDGDAHAVRVAAGCHDGA
jgi:hypothetical protein